ncbi:hypothetical protein [Streptomyces xanthochromogenes]|uniref:hypothetical protein n=1 Tax=Streptomyces xanthochromogenes TaxID=67384 RepID=UPI00344625A7
MGSRSRAIERLRQHRGEHAALGDVRAPQPVRHNHLGGTATITTGTMGDTVYLEVSNTGPALTPDEVPALFTPFHHGLGEQRYSG